MDASFSLNILFILNPISGGKKKIDWEPLIRDYFKSLPHKIELFILTGKNDADSIKYWIKKFSPHRVVVAGGDGSISLVAKILAGSSIPLAMLRGGSANGMAAELKIPEEPQEALDLILNGRIQDSDMIRIDDEDICLHLSDLGLNARLIKYFDKSSFRGMWGYARVFLKILWEGKLLRAHIETDDSTQDVSAYMIVIANASKYGTGAVINPEGLVHDGKFELVIVRKISLREFVKLFLNNKPFDPKKVEVVQATKAIITTRRVTHFQVDGEYKGKVKKVSAVIDSSSIKLIVPVEEEKASK